MFTRPLNALLYAVLDILIRVQTAYRLSKHIAKHTWVLQCAIDVLALRTRARAHARICKHGSPYAIYGCNSLQVCNVGHICEYTPRIIV